MKCDICGNELKEVGASLICKNGHTIQNTLKTVDDHIMISGGRKRKVRAKKDFKTSVMCEYDPSVLRLLVIFLLYEEAKVFFSIKSDDALRYFSGYFTLFENKPEILDNLLSIVENPFDVTLNGVDFKEIENIKDNLEEKYREKMEKYNKEALNKIKTSQEIVNNLFNQPIDQSINQSFNNSNQSFNNSNQSFNNSNQSFNNTNQSFNNNNQSFNNTNQSFDNNNQSFNNSNQSFNNSNQSFNNSNHLINLVNNKMINTKNEIEKIKDKSERRKIKKIMRNIQDKNRSVMIDKLLGTIRPSVENNRRTAIKEISDDTESEESMSEGVPYIEGDEFIKYNTLHALVYMAKRSEMERAGSAYFFSDFLERIESFNLIQRLKQILKKYGISSRIFLMLTRFPGKIKPIEIETKLRNFASFDAFINRFFEESEGHPTGVIPKHIEDLKKNVRTLFVNDLSIYRQYFDHLCKKLGIEQTDDIIFYWKKLIFTFNHDQVFVPEVLFSKFIAQYFINQYSFEDTFLERRILSILGYSKVKFSDIMLTFARELDYYRDPGTFLRYRELQYTDRYRNIRRAIWIIDGFKELYK